MRFEIKFAYAPQYDGQVRDWLMHHECAFSEAYPTRRVQNVYFDTFDLESFGENLAGVGRRSKVRYRWYGEEGLLPAGTLEIKNKHSQLGWKDSHRIATPPFQDGDSWKAIHRKIRASIPRAMRLIFDDHPQAALVNRYTRSYFESNDGLIRVTLDSDQEMFDQTASRCPNITRKTNIPDVHILELKCAAEHKRLATRALGSCPVRASRFSKYTVGVESR